jgi:tetratricopeptide (TPR) repeat protein
MGVLKVKSRFVSAIVLMMLALSAGCVPSLTGAHYLQQEDYDEGIRSMRQELAQNPNDPAANYYLGRMYMAKQEPEPALPYLEKAAKLDPEDSDYHFWVGVANWALLNFDKEREAYRRALQANTRHVSANLYLAHNYLDRGEWENALAFYDRVLELDPYNPEALYSRGEALYGMGRKEEAHQAWLEFMEAYPDGVLGFKATENLNLLGDYTYRNYILGQRKITLRVPRFEMGETIMTLTDESKPSLSVLGAMLENNRKLDVHVVVFDASGAASAKRKALLIRNYVSRMWPEVDPSRLKPSWFGQGEKVETEDGTMTLDETVKFITVVE